MPELDSALNEQPVASPCISVCVLDVGDICTGCYRSVDEIRAWSAYSNEERRTCKERAVAREKKINCEGL